MSDKQTLRTITRRLLRCREWFLNVIGKVLSCGNKYFAVYVAGVVVLCIGWLFQAGSLFLAVVLGGLCGWWLAYALAFLVLLAFKLFLPLFDLLFFPVILLGRWYGYRSAGVSARTYFADFFPPLEINTVLRLALVLFGVELIFGVFGDD